MGQLNLTRRWAIPFALAAALTVGTILALTAATRTTAQANDEGQSSTPSQAQPIPAKEMPVRMANASEFEQALIADGVVTPDEYNKAVVAAWNCTVERTASIGGVTVNPLVTMNGRAQFGGHSATTREAIDAANEAHLGCVREYLDDVSAASASGGGYARVQPAWNFIAQCMAQQGAEVPAEPNYRELREASFAAVGDQSLYDSCARQVPAELRPLGTGKQVPRTPGSRGVQEHN